MSRRPRLLIDLSAAFNQGAGIGRYARNLVAATAPLLDADFELAGWYAPDAGTADRFHALAADTLGALAATATRSRLSRRRVDQLWFRLPLAATARVMLQRAALVYSPDFTAPPVPGARGIVTVHDLAFVRTPEYCPEPLRRYLSGVVPRQVQRAERVVVVSEATRSDVIETYGVEEARIRVIPNAADERFFDATPPSAAVRRQLRLPDRYLLTVGTLEPRKNHATIFAAARRVYADTGIPLAVVGRDGWSNAEIRRQIKELVERGTVIDLTNAEDSLLPGLYAGSAATVQLSWHEGFGIPVVEALAAGAPVVASDIAAHREVAGGAAALVAPGDVDGVVAATLRAVGGSEPGRREAGKHAAAAYSWDRSATMLADLLREVNDGREAG